MATYRSVQTRITESLSTSARVDREAGVIRGVKLIGFESKNGRIYPPKVLKSSVHLYEGSKVNVDHPDYGPPKDRKYADRMGQIRNTRFVEGQGIYADFHFNPKHALAEQLCWDAENNPEVLGFSHNAMLRLGAVKEGKQQIEEIIAIRSMDLVADPAATRTLFESETPMDDDPVMDKPTDPSEQIKAAFKQMISAAIDDTSLDMKATMAKVREIMKAQEKLMGGGSSSKEEPTEEEGEESVTPNNAELALLKQQLQQYQQKEKQAQLVESIDKQLVNAGLDRKNPAHVSELFSKQLMATESEDDRKALIADRASILGAKPVKESQQPVYRPQSGGADTYESLDAKSVASRLLC